MSQTRPQQRERSLKIADASSQDVELAQAGASRQLLIGGAVLAVLVLFGVFAAPSISRWISAEDAVSRDRLRVAVVERGDLIRDVSVQGRVVAAVSPTLYASETGTITFDANAGDAVTENTLLTTIDSPELTNRLEQEKANLQRREVEMERQVIQSKQQNLANQKAVDLAQLQLTAASRESRRAIEAYEKEAISQLDFEKAQDELESAEYAHSHAVADQKLDRERLAFEQHTKELEVEQQRLLVADLDRQIDELTIRSPVTGIVGNLLVDQKTNVARNQAVLSVVDLSRFEVEAQIPESYADDLAIGMRAEINSGTEVWSATLISVSPEIIDNQVTARVRFDEDPPSGLRQNQRLTTRVLLEAKEDVLKVTRGQFLESGGGRIAFKIDDDIAYKTNIVVGARSLNAVEIVSGLDAGDTIIISSTDNFVDAETVLITDN